MNNTLARLAAPLLILLSVALVLLNFQSVRDFAVANSFRPSADVAAVEGKLHLTDYGKMVFRASTPSLDSRDVFNQECSTVSSETSILGCFTGSKIHVFDIRAQEFDGIVESTAAHELLHAVWARMDDHQKSNLSSALSSVLDASNSDFRKSLEPYDQSSQLEEIYVRSATQIKSLPDNLEAHFADIFQDQDSVVDFYDSYSRPFAELEATLAELSEQIDSLKSKISSESASYASRVESFNSAAAEFNSCASTPNCFSDATFNSRRASLLAEKSAIDDLYDTLDSDITTYNRQIDTYNAKVLYGRSLETIINSNPKPQENL